MQLKLYIVEYENAIKGDWRIALDLGAFNEIIKIPCTIRKEGLAIETIEVSSLGLTLRVKGTSLTLIENVNEF